MLAGIHSPTAQNQDCKPGTPSFQIQLQTPHRLWITKEPDRLSLDQNIWSHNRETWAWTIPENFGEGGQQVAWQAGQVGGKRAE